MRSVRPTDAELRVLQLIARGWTDKEAAHELGIAESTAKTHTANLIRRMHVRNRTHAAVVAVCRGWIEC